MDYDVFVGVDGSCRYRRAPVRSSPPMPLPLRGDLYRDYDAILEAKWTLTRARKMKRLRRELGARRFKLYIAGHAAA